MSAAAHDTHGKEHGAEHKTPAASHDANQGSSDYGSKGNKGKGLGAALAIGGIVAILAGIGGLFGNDSNYHVNEKISSNYQMHSSVYDTNSPSQNYSNSYNPSSNYKI